MSNLDELRAKYIVDKEPTKVQESNKEDNVNIEIDKLVDFRNNQPFLFYDNDKKEEMMESIKKYGVMTPIIVRKIEDDKYEILSGHNRVRCSKELGLSTIPAQIVDCDDKKATIIMLDSNLCNREKILPVEKGYAYKMKKGITNLFPKETEESRTQIYRYIRLTELIKYFQDKVNNNEIEIKTGVEISFLKKEEQEILSQVLEDEKIKISLVQAQKIRSIKENIEYRTIINELKNGDKQEKFTGKIEKLAVKKYKDKFKNDKEFTELIVRLLEEYFSSDSES